MSPLPDTTINLAVMPIDTDPDSTRYGPIRLTAGHRHWGDTCLFISQNSVSGNTPDEIYVNVAQLDELIVHLKELQRQLHMRVRPELNLVVGGVYCDRDGDFWTITSEALGYGERFTHDYTTYYVMTPGDWASRPETCDIGNQIWTKEDLQKEGWKPA